CSCITVMLAVLSTLMPVTQVRAAATLTITADNSYSFGYGTVSGISAPDMHTFIDNCVHTSDITGCGTGVPPSNGPEVYSNVSEGPILYIIAYGDDAVTQGVLA